MDRNDEPFAGLEDWAKQAEKRVRRQARGSVLRRFVRIVMAVAVAGALLAATPTILRTFRPNASAAAGSYPTAAVPSGITVTSSESAAPTDPFAGTPAATYPKGAAGITMPAAAKVTGFSAAQVGADLQRVRAAMIAGRLDQRMLVAHQPGKFLALLAPDSHKDVQGWFRTGDFPGIATWIDPSVQLDAAESPRVSGRITYRPVVEQGLLVLQVTTNFIWVYAFTGPQHPIAAEHDQIEWEFYPASTKVRVADRGLWIRDVDSYSAWADCAAARRGMLAPTGADAVAPQPSDTEDPDNYLRADHSLDIPDDCGTARSPSPAVSPS